MHLCEQTLDNVFGFWFQNYLFPFSWCTVWWGACFCKSFSRIFSCKSHIDPNILDIYLVAACSCVALCSFPVTAIFIQASIVVENGSNLRVFLEIIYDFLYSVSQFHTCGDLCAILADYTITKSEVKNQTITQHSSRAIYKTPDWHVRHSNFRVIFLIDIDRHRHVMKQLVLFVVKFSHEARITIFYTEWLTIGGRGKI